MKPFFQPEPRTNFDPRFMNKVQKLFSADYELNGVEGFYVHLLTIPSRITEEQYKTLSAIRKLAEFTSPSFPLPSQKLFRCGAPHRTSNSPPSNTMAKVNNRSWSLVWMYYLRTPCYTAPGVIFRVSKIVFIFNSTRTSRALHSMIFLSWRWRILPTISTLTLF